MATTATINVHELMQIADAVAREKNVDRNVVIEALQEAIAKSARQRYGAEYDIRVTIVPKGGNIIISRYREIVDNDAVFEEFEHPAFYIKLSEARERDDNLQIGDFVVDELPSVEIGRISAQSARQVIVQKIREAERDSQYEEFKDRIGEIIHVTVRRVEFGNVTVSLGDFGEAIIKRNETIARENFRVGDRIRCYIYDVRRENSGPQIFLSRTHPQFMAKLFASEVPEIYDGVIEIKAVARDPGSRAKIAVYTNDSSVDPVGCCVGLRGGRVQAVTNELQGERIDIIEWSPDAAKFIMNALSPVEVIRVVVDDECDKVEVVVPDDALTAVIGRRGQNVRLLAHLLGWDVDILTQTNDSQRRQNEFSERSELFVSELDVGILLAQFLASEGFSSIEDIAYTELEELQAIEGLDSNVAAELQERALQAIEVKKVTMLDTMGVSNTLRAIDGLSVDMLLELARNNVKTLEDFAGLTVDELVANEDNSDDGDDTPYLSYYDLDAADVTKMIMAARKALGWI